MPYRACNAEGDPTIEMRHIIGKGVHRCSAGCEAMGVRGEKETSEEGGMRERDLPQWWQCIIVMSSSLFESLASTLCSMYHQAGCVHALHPSRLPPLSYPLTDCVWCADGTTI